jgi:hypothetical protein
MELNFGFLVFAALVGLIINAIYGWNPVAILGSISLMILFLPLVGILTASDAEAAHSIAERSFLRVIEAMPSIFLGEFAGYIAGEVFKPFKRWF